MASKKKGFGFLKKVKTTKTENTAHEGNDESIEVFKQVTLDNQLDAQNSTRTDIFSAKDNLSGVVELGRKDVSVLGDQFGETDHESIDVSNDRFAPQSRDESEDLIKDLNKAVEDEYLERFESAEDDDETFVDIDADNIDESEIEIEQMTESRSRRLFYGRASSYRNIYSDPKSQEDINWNAWETFSAISGMNVSELVRKAEMGDLVLDSRALSRLRKRFVSMQKMFKRQFYKCRDRYVIPEQIPTWNEECKKLNITPTEVGDDALNRKVALMHGDITTLEVDAVVNSISSHVTDRHEGVSSAIVKAASSLMYYELESIWIIYVGGVEATAGYLLPAKYVFHTSGPTRHDDDFESQLTLCYRNCLDKMLQMGLRTLAVPCIATGAKKVNARKAAETAMSTVKEWLQRNWDSVDKIIFCVYDIDNWACYQELMPVIFPPSYIIDTSEASLIPVEILRMDKNSIELYKRALSDGKEAVHAIRVMVVGHYGVGKTTLTKRLFGEEVDINQRQSTNGIDVHVRRCKVSMDTEEWNILDKDKKVESAYHRLVKLLNRSTSDEKSIDTQDFETQAGIDEGEDTVDGFMTKNLLNIENEPTDETEGNEEENVEETTAKSLHVETNAKDESSSIKPKEEDILNHLKKLIEDVQQHSAVDDESNTADVSVWDFAGQYVFYATHQVFLSRRAVYLLVTDISKRLDDIVQDDDCFSDSKGAKQWTILEFVNFWMNSIHEFCSTSEDEGPPVLLVGTCADKLDPETKMKAIDEFFYKLRSSLLDKATSCHLIEEDFAVDNSVVDSNIELLRKQILNTASKQAYWGELIPAKWITLENIILGLKDDGLKVLLKDRLHDLNNTLPVPIETEEELELFLRFHHDSGNILYYSDDKLNDSIVLDPQWLINAFKSLITAKMFCCRKSQNVFKKWNQFDQSAILTVDLVDAIWEKKENSEFHEHRELLLDYLEKLGFIAKPRQPADDTEMADSYFAPCVLKTSPPEDLLSCKDCKNRRSTSKMCFTTASGFLPTAVFNKLLAACISKWPLSKKNKKCLISCGCGLFDLADNHTLYVYFFDHVIQIWVTRLSTKDLEPDFRLCSEVYDFVSDLLQNRLRLLSGIEHFVRCHSSELYSNDNMFAIDEIAEKLDVVCNCTPEPHVLRTKELTKYWSDAAFDHDVQIPTEKEISRVAHHIGKEYQSLGLELGISQAAIDQINLDSKTTVDRIRRMLLKWKENEGDKATLDVLVKAMEGVGIDAQTVLENAGITN